MINFSNDSYSPSSTMPAGLTPLRLIRMPGGEASTSLQKAFVRDQSMFEYEVTEVSKRLRKVGKALASLIFCRELRELRKRS